MFKKTLTVLCLILVSQNLFATGPSYINIEIEPIAYSSEFGHVLCKTRRLENKSGGRYLPSEDFGWLIAKENGETIELKSTRFVGEYESESNLDEFETLKLFNKIYSSGMTLSMATAQYPETILPLKFDTEELSRFKVNQVHSVNKENYEKENTNQYTLGGHYSTEIPQFLHLTYYFGKIKFYKNYENRYSHNLRIGSYFNYTFPIGGYTGKFPYDDFSIDGYSVDLDYNK